MRLLQVQDLLTSIMSSGKSVEQQEGDVVAVLTWLRFSSSRLLIWNKNYNIKPREISAAQVWSIICLHSADFMLPHPDTAASLTDVSLPPAAVFWGKRNAVLNWSRKTPRASLSII